MKLQDIINGMTPGPWRGEQRSYAGVKWDNIIRSARNNDPICTAFVAGYMAKEAAANAAAIALAPKGVKALMLLRQIVNWHYTDDRVPRPSPAVGNLMQAVDEAHALLVGIDL